MRILTKSLYNILLLSDIQVLHGMDLREKTAVVTGANSGIGFEIARTLAFHGCKVIFACRYKSSSYLFNIFLKNNLFKNNFHDRKLCEAQEAIERVKGERPHAECVAMHLNLCSMTQVKKNHILQSSITVELTMGCVLQVTCFAEEFLKEHSSLDVLVLNAGIFGKDYSLTEDQLDETFQVDSIAKRYRTLFKKYFCNNR